MKSSPEMERRAKLRRSKWNANAVPYFKECLTCTLCCDQVMATKGHVYNILVCPKKHTGEPMFPYKLQHFIFSCPIRLYNSWLHNNRNGIGMKMSQIKMPKIQVPNSNAQGFKNPANPSSLLAYMGFKGAKTASAPAGSWNKVNALPILMYYDIFKNYFANKQEENAYYIGGLTKVADSITFINDTQSPFLTAFGGP